MRHRRETRSTGRLLASALAVVLVGSAVLATVAAAGSGQDDVKVGLITKDVTNPFFVKMKLGATTEAKRLGAELKYAAGKPLLFGKEPAAAPNPAGTTVLWLGSDDEAFGPATTLREVDWLAVKGDSKVIDGPICKYQDMQTGKISTAPLKLVTPEVLIYERRTARVVDRRTFQALPSCPSEKRKRDDTVVAGHHLVSPHRRLLLVFASGPPTRGTPVGNGNTLRRPLVAGISKALLGLASERGHSHRAPATGNRGTRSRAFRGGSA